jgi:uncharacterized membrane protein
MSSGPSATARKLPRLIRIVRARPRLFLSACLALVVIVLVPAEFRWATRLLVGWDIGVATYLALAIITFARESVAHIRRQAALQDEGAVAILILTAGAALASLAAIVAELGASGKSPAHLALAVVTIFLSWMFTHVIFALHYAHEFYQSEAGADRGLSFPGDGDPDYWDFVYFSFVIGMTSQVSDVAVTSRTIRRTVSAHGLVSFVFNATLLALTVNIAASII